jgi:hypothetical protein
VNVPIGIATAVLAVRLLEESRGDPSQKRLDLPGALSVTAGLSILVYALTSAANDGLLSFQTLAPLAVSGVVLAGFLVIEHKSSAPLMPLGFLRRGAVFSANALAILTISAVSSMIFLLTIYLQTIQGYSALSAGLAFLPTALIFLSVGGYLSGKLVTRFGAKPVLLVGMTIQTAGFLLLGQLSVGTPYLTGLLPEMLIVSLGAALSFTAFNIAALSGARKGEEGLASGLINTSTQVGGPIGLAIAVTIVGVVVASLGSSVTAAAATVEGFRYAFLGGASLSGIGIAFALVIRSPRTVVMPHGQALEVPSPQSPAVPQSGMSVAMGNGPQGRRSASQGTTGRSSTSCASSRHPPGWLPRVSGQEGPGPLSSRSGTTTPTKRLRPTSTRSSARPRRQGCPTQKEPSSGRTGRRPTP